MKYSILMMLLAAAMLLSCSSGQSDTERYVQLVTGENPAQPGFDHEGSDPEAIDIADRVMAAMGGRQAWDNTRHLRWNFFGFRTLYWDKWTGDLRVEIPSSKTRILLNINENTGRAWRDGAEMAHPDSVAKYVQQGKSIWINDSYWFVMPFKLKDSGVTLTYLGTDETDRGGDAELIELRFKNVGNTPDNKYHVWVDKQTHLVSQWAYFSRYDLETPNFTGPWTDYNRHGEILLSGGRGEREISDIAVFAELPGSVYNSFEDVHLQ
ncbi:MAG: hypothetical protein EA364_01560 [Balneolaceae bacterium]|nr:MAG: hypothetical protein EA364_01560 [Balneolaceae bacterium]